MSIDHEQRGHAHRIFHAYAYSTTLYIYFTHIAHMTVKPYTVFPRVEAAATINLTCSSTAATIRGRLQFEGGYYIPCA